MSSPGDEGGSRGCFGQFLHRWPCTFGCCAPLHPEAGQEHDTNLKVPSILARPQCRLIWIRAWRAERPGIAAATTAAGCNHRRAPGFDRLARSCSAGGRSPAPCGCAQSVRSLPAWIPQNRPRKAQPLPLLPLSRLPMRRAIRTPADLLSNRTPDCRASREPPPQEKSRPAWRLH